MENGTDVSSARDFDVKSLQPHLAVLSSILCDRHTTLRTELDITVSEAL